MKWLKRILKKILSLQISRQIYYELRSKNQKAYSINGDFKSQLEKVFNNEYNSSNEIVVGLTSNFIMNDLKAPSYLSNLPITMNPNKAYFDMVSKEKAIEDNKYKDNENKLHNLGVDLLYDVIVDSETPVAAYVYINPITNQPSQNRITF